MSDQDFRGQSSDNSVEWSEVPWFRDPPLAQAQCEVQPRPTARRGVVPRRRRRVLRCSGASRSPKERGFGPRRPCFFSAKLRVGSPKLRRIGSGSAAGPRVVQNIAQWCQASMAKKRSATVPSAAPQQHHAQHRRSGRRAVLTSELRRVRRPVVRFANRSKRPSAPQGCHACPRGAQHAQPCLETPTYVARVRNLCCASSCAG